MQDQIFKELNELLNKHEQDAQQFQNLAAIRDYQTLTEACASHDYEQQVQVLRQWFENNRNKDIETVRREFETRAQKRRESTRETFLDIGTNPDAPANQLWVEFMSVLYRDKTITEENTNDDHSAQRRHHYWY